MAVKQTDKKRKAEELPVEVPQEVEESKPESRKISPEKKPSNKIRLFNISTQNIEIELHCEKTVRIGSRHLSEELDRSILQNPVVKFYMNANELLIRE